MVRFFDGAVRRARGNLRGAAMRGAALAALLSLIVGGARVCVREARPAFFSLLFPQLMHWQGEAWDDGASVEATPSEAVAL